MVEFRSQLLVLTVLCAAGCQSALNWDSGPEAAATERPAKRTAVSTNGKYEVRRGDTLYAIAWRHGLDHRDVARWNKLGSGGLITPGQVLRLRPPPSTPTATAGKPTSGSQAPQPARSASQPAPSWVWPLSGPTLASFRTGEPTRTGLFIGGERGAPVRAAANGKVVYAGSGLIGYGPLVIVKHNETYLSAYGHNEELLVGEGESVTRGQVIAKVGLGPERRPGLHFEIRKNGAPVNPGQYLPRR